MMKIKKMTRDTKYQMEFSRLSEDTKREAEYSELHSLLEREIEAEWMACRVLPLPKKASSVRAADSSDGSSRWVRLRYFLAVVIMEILRKHGAPP